MIRVFRYISILFMACLPWTSQAAGPPSCAIGPEGAPSGATRPHNPKDAKASFNRGTKLVKLGRFEEALREYDRATHLAPGNPHYLAAREQARQQLVFTHLQQGSSELAAGRQVQAMAEFRSVLELDPENRSAEQQIQQVLGPGPAMKGDRLELLEESPEIQFYPQDKLSDFHYRGDSRGLLTQVAAQYGVAVTFDDSVQTKRVRFDIEKVDFFKAIRSASLLTKTFWTPLDGRQVLIVADAPENRRQFEHMAMRSFRVPGATSPQELNDTANVMRAIFDMHFVSIQPASQKIVLRAPLDVLDGATKFLENLTDSPPQVMLDLKAYEVSRTFTRALGLHIPNQFQMFNIPAAALSLLGGQNIQDLINQLISSGGINQANNTSLSALLAQLQNQGNSLLNSNVATFGGGLTLFGLSLDKLSATLSLNESAVRNLEHLSMRAEQNKDATFHLGTRYPIINASFAPIFNNQAISQVIQNNSFQAPVPSVNYEDLGLSLKVKPAIHGNLDVGLQVELQFRALTGQSSNGVPVISNREYKGTIVLKNGEPAIIAGSVSRSDQRSLTGIPGLAFSPLGTQQNRQEDDDELLIVITPHVTSAPQGRGREIWMARGAP